MLLVIQAQSERQENAHLKAENEKLLVENMRYKEAFSKATCTTCGGPASPGEMSYDEQFMKLENARLREEVPPITITQDLIVNYLITILSFPMLIKISHISD